MSLTLPLVDAPAAAEAEVTDEFRYWQRRILISSIVGYALYYLVRKNLSAAMPVIEEELDISKTDLGGFLTAHGLLYGVSKFANGVVGDRVNARWFLLTGLVICAGCSILFGLSSSVLAFGTFWAINGWFQGMGFPPCARLMTHWFSPAQLATKMSIWNVSHTIGTIAALVLCGYLAEIDWRLCFFVPAGIVLVGAVYVAIRLRDTPESLGLPPLEGAVEAKQHEPVGESLRRLVFSNRNIWLFSFANFFVYAVRYGILDWGPTFLKQARGFELTSASWTTAAFELAGMFGMLTSGWITDRFFGGRGSRTCLFYMILCTLALLAFWLIPMQSGATSVALLCIAGFFVYGPQCLVGISVANLATRQAAAAAVGLTGLFGYLSTVLSGWGVGWLVKNYGWDAGFMTFALCGIGGIFFFLLAWPAKAHGYQ
jgi:phosphoglycerate transporter family protein